jgi:hypothetical protein
MHSIGLYRWPWPPKAGELLPRAAEAYTVPEKLAWIFSDEGHGQEWAHVLHIGESDAQRFWDAIARVILDAPIHRVNDREPHGIVCGVETSIAVGKRTAKAQTVWHYKYARDAPRLVTVYPIR